MPQRKSIAAPESFQTFGDLLVHLRKRARLTQEELGRAVGYSRPQITLLEKNQRLPSAATVSALFVPALDLDDAPELAQRLITLAALARKPRTNLPALINVLIGRGHETAQVRDYLLTPDKRLVTLIGPPGIGKTRLSLQVATELLPDFADGVFFVPLTPIEDPDLVASAIEQTLGFVQTDQRSVLERLKTGINDRQLLIVLDNFEQVIEAASLAPELLAACPRLKLIITSRESLRVPGEWLYPVPPLTIPAEEQLKTLTLGAADHFSALHLFVERARAVRPDFSLASDNVASIAMICQRLDGLPLAIELIAARIRLLSPQALLSRLTSDFALHADGMRGVPPRHKTLYNAIAWSYGLLSPSEQQLLARLSVFSGGFTPEAAQTVTQLPNVIAGLTSLLNKSLLLSTLDADGGARFDLLVMIHDFALDRLRESNEESVMRDRHVAYFFELARQAQAHWFGPEEARWTDQLEHESLNLHAALIWSFAQGAVKETLLAVYRLHGLWTARVRFTEGGQWYARLLPAYPEADNLKLRGLFMGLILARLRHDFAQMRAYLTEARALAEAIGDPLKAALLREEALYAREHGDAATAIADLKQAIQLHRQEQPSDLSEVNLCEALYWLAETWMLQGELEKSRPLWEEGLAWARERGSASYMSWGLSGLARLARLAGQCEKAADLSCESLAIKLQHRDRAGVAYALEELALVAAEQGNFDRTVILWSAAQHYRDILQAPALRVWQVEVETHLARANVQLGIDRFKTLQSEGRALSVEQAIEMALQTTN